MSSHISESVQVPASAFANGQIPPLENGDRLTRDEFERRYEAMPHLKKAELIEGVVYMAAAVRLPQHGRPHGHLISWLGIYEAFTPHVQIGDNTTIRLDLENEPQPDGLLIVDPGKGGNAILDEDGYIVRSPEWIGEVAASSASYDLGPKLRAFERNEVQEYMVWRVLDRAIDWFLLRSAKYERLVRSSEDYLKSVVFPGLWLDPQAMIEGNMVKVFEVLQEGLKSPEHHAFISRLQQRSS